MRNAIADFQIYADLVGQIYCQRFHRRDLIGYNRAQNNAIQRIRNYSLIMQDMYFIALLQYHTISDGI